MNRFETAGEVMDRFRKQIKPFNPTIDDVELEIDAGYIAGANRLLVEKNAIALLHNYMPQTVFIGINGLRGDSLELTRKAIQLPAEIAMWAGVPFMAETTAVMCDKDVLIASQEAGCSLADDCRAKDAIWYREQYPGIPIVAYINSYADVKAEVDWCCTSGNMINVVKAAMEEAGTKSVIFLPDKYMAGNIARELGMDLYYPSNNGDVPDYKNKPTVIGGKARCYVHEQFTVDNINQVEEAYPGSLKIIHPEAKREVVDRVLELGGISGSTSQMVKAVENVKPGQRVALFTECSLGDNLLALRPELSENLVRMCNVTCKHMKMTTARGIYESLRDDKYKVTVPEPTRSRARRSIEKMLSVK